MKSRGGCKSQRREEKRRRKKIKKRKSQKKEDPGGNSRNTLFFQWFEALEGRKVGSLKRWVRSLLGRWEMKNCTPLWREARPGPDHFWKLRRPKSACCCGAKHISKSKCTKHIRSGPLLEVEMSKKCTPLWREAHFEVKMYKAHQVRTTFGSWDVEKVRAIVARSTFRSQHVRNTRVSDHFWTFRCRFAWQVQGIVHLVKSEQIVGFCSISKNDGRRGAFEEDLQRFLFSWRRSARDMLIRAVRRSACWFPERGCIVEHQIFRFTEMILRERCSTSYDLASLFRGRRSTLNKRSGKIPKRIGTRPSALHSAFHVWKGSRRIVSFLMLSTSKLEDVSQNCFVFLMLSTSNIEDVSQDCFVFDVVKFKNWGGLAELLRFQACR